MVAAACWYTGLQHRPREKIWFDAETIPKASRMVQATGGVYRTNGNPICQCTCEGVAWPHQSSFILSLLTEGGSPLYKLWAHTSTCGWPIYVRVGLKSELIPGGCLTFTEDSHHWQLPEHSTEASPLPAFPLLSKQRAVSATVHLVSTHKRDRE